MSDHKKIFYILASIAGILFLPYIGAYIHLNGDFPEDYFAFPALTAPAKAPFSLLVFCGVGVMFTASIVLYFYPYIFGFKRVPPVPKQTFQKVKLPGWFWVGSIVFGTTLFLSWMKFSEPHFIINWGALPLFWGFTLMLDGWVFIRTGGKSLIAKSPREILAIGFASIFGWMIFEYLNFFVDDNWVYPQGALIADDEFVIYALLGSAGLMPMVFEWYSLFNTFPKFRDSFTQGPKIIFPNWLKIALVVGCFAGMFSSAFFPDVMFECLWIGPLVIISIVLNELKIWTPWTPMGKGNWSPMLLVALAFLVQGFLTEFWNFYSAHDIMGNVTACYNPDHWTYSVPYVNCLHVFEMPLMGLFGYLPFGVYSGVWWILFAYLLDIPTQFSETGHKNV